MTVRMTVYDQLSPPYRAIVDQVAAETADQGWDVRRAYLTSVYHALDRAQVPEAEEALAAIIAGLVERLGEPAIAEGLQAGIYAASAAPEHREASAAWFDLHPDDYAVIQRELTEGRRLN